MSILLAGKSRGLFEERKVLNALFRGVPQAEIKNNK
jgi:hypothetical protein